MADVGIEELTEEQKKKTQEILKKEISFIADLGVSVSTLRKP